MTPRSLYLLGLIAVLAS